VSRRQGINNKQLREILDKPFYNTTERGQAAKARVQDDLARRSVLVAKPNKQPSLGGKSKNPPGMVNIPGPVHCRIIRNIPKGGKSYDDDNLSGGLKECRDAIAAMLGLEGDSREDGITFSYEEKIGASGVAATEIEIYSVED